MIASPRKRGEPGGHEGSTRRLGARMGQSMAVGQQFRKFLGY